MKKGIIGMSMMLLLSLAVVLATGDLVVTIDDAIVSIEHRTQGGAAVPLLQKNVFGVTAYEGGDIFETTNGTEWVREWGVETVGFPLSLNSYNLPQPTLLNGSSIPCPGPRNVTEEELRTWWDPANNAGAEEKFVRGRWPSSVYPWGRWLTNIAPAADPFVYLLGNTWGNGECNTCAVGPPQNATLWGIANGLAVRLARTTAPGIRMAHIANEPNAHWYHQIPHNTGGAFASFFVEASLGIKEVVGGDLKVGGPVLCWGPLNGYVGLSQWSWFSDLMDKGLRIQRSPGVCVVVVVVMCVWEGFM
jgi:hypothetical protein